MLHVWNSYPETWVEVWVFIDALLRDATNISNDAICHLGEVAGAHGVTCYAMRMMAFEASAAGKMIEKSPAVDVLSDPKSSTTTVGLV